MSVSDNAQRVSQAAMRQRLHLHGKRAAIGCPREQRGLWKISETRSHEEVEVASSQHIHSSWSEHYSGIKQGLRRCVVQGSLRWGDERDVIHPSELSLLTT